MQCTLAAGPRATPLLPVPAGTFMMGSPARPDELPVRRVTLGAFAAAPWPVTNAEYARFLEATGYTPPRFWVDARFNAPRQPVVGVSWFDAVAYCAWLGALLGRRCRLPTEAEREYAARGGLADLAYPWGDEPLTEGLFAPGAAGMDRPQPVASRAIAGGPVAPNPFGLWHMAENVHEWCSDWYDPAGYPPGDVRDPQGPPAGTRRASRGGAWRHRLKVSRISARSSLAPELRYNDYGFRVYADS
ncbi:MAG: formylglycine-generating enzyme family protein [Chloroflexi bacterium]|nr:formylglycine-generating enzyme family protein [Chloroflexota bacterium]